MTDLPPPDPEADARLLAELSAALGDDPLPEGLLARAEGLLAFADVDAELAALLDAAAFEAAGTRGDATAELLTFEVADGALTVELSLGRGGAEGQLLGDPVTALAVESTDGTRRAVAVDALGRFALTAEPGGPVRLRITTDDGRTVVTDWFPL